MSEHFPQPLVSFDLLRRSLVGTLAYLSPDRLAGKAATIADDLYAVGCVGYEALSGRRPFTEEKLRALARAILDDTPPPLAALRPDADPALAAVIERAMARDPRWRFANAEAMRAALWDRAHHAAAAPARPPTLMLTRPFPAIPPTGVYIPAATSTIQPRRTRKLAAIAAIIGVFALAAVLLVFNPPFQRHTRNRAHQHQHNPSTPVQQSRHHSFHRPNHKPGRATRERTQKTQKTLIANQPMMNDFEPTRVSCALPLEARKMARCQTSGSTITPRLGRSAGP